eukprot:TRINITY_DN2791_c0_g2_i1.p2 TRINITY_DN2791_c0_g2~~TRINITY_DN2791_c0_g2_i1.p2  ORF type:complete len:206 (+),score=-17.65 TRINITY_DN2791_c0_g2_i1:174-791(+)
MQYKIQNIQQHFTLISFHKMIYKKLLPNTYASFQWCVLNTKKNLSVHKTSNINNPYKSYVLSIQTEIGQTQYQICQIKQTVHRINITRSHLCNLPKILLVMAVLQVLVFSLHTLYILINFVLIISCISTYLNFYNIFKTYRPRQNNKLHEHLILHRKYLHIFMELLQNFAILTHVNSSFLAVKYARGEHKKFFFITKLERFMFVQ